MDLQTQIIASLKESEGMENNQLMESEKDSVCEAKIVCASREKFTKDPLYKRLVSISKEMLKQIEEPLAYRDEFMAKPYEYIRQELDNYSYIANHLAKVELDGFPDEVKEKVKKLLTSAMRGVNRAEGIFKKLSPDMTADDIPSAFKHLTYIKRSVVLLGDFFALLNISWDYPSFYVNPKEVWAHYGASDSTSKGKQFPFKTPRELGLTKDSIEVPSKAFKEAMDILSTAGTATELYGIVDLTVDESLKGAELKCVVDAMKQLKQRS